MAGNAGYGVSITDRAYNNSVYNTNIGYGDALSDGLEPSIPNEWGGVLLDQGTSGSLIGGNKSPLGNKISSNDGGGITIWSSTKNYILGNQIKLNTEFGIYGVGVCTGTVISGNTIQNNGLIDLDNVDISEATGIRYTP